MTVYVVQNASGIVMAIFETKIRAKTFIKGVGQKRWNEMWLVGEYQIGEVDNWIMQGSELYQAHQNICSKCKQRRR